MRITATQRLETIIHDDGTLEQTTKKLVRIESNDFDELELDEINDIVVDALKKHYDRVLTNNNR